MNFRGANVEDLQLSPALVLPSSTDVGTALRMAFERDFSILPISNPETRRLQGWIDIALLRKGLEENVIGEELELGQVTPGEWKKRFPKTMDYKVITPDTPLEELATFFEEESNKASFALITDSARKFVLGVCTLEDLKKFSDRRNPNKV